MVGQASNSSIRRALRALVLHLGEFQATDGAQAWNVASARTVGPDGVARWGFQAKTYKLVSKPGSPFLRWVRTGTVGPACDSRAAAETFGPLHLPRMECRHNDLVLNLDAVLEAAEESRIRLGVATYWLCYRQRGKRFGLALAQSERVGRSKMLFLVKRLGSCTHRQLDSLARSADILHIARVLTIPMHHGARMEIG